MPPYILVIEDDDAIRESLTEVLELENFVVKSAENGQLGIEFLESCKTIPSLVIIDIMMPVIDGFAVTEYLRAEPRFAGLPYLIMSADGQAKTKQQKTGARAFLKKPVDIDELLATIRTHMKTAE